jgi:hypothetical protein
MEQIDIFEADKLLELKKKKAKFEEVIKACGAPLKIVAVNKYYESFIAEYEGELKHFYFGGGPYPKWKSDKGCIRYDGYIAGYYISSEKGIPPNYEWV